MVTGRTLLLADDSATIQKVVDLTFTDEGLEVITVSDGQQALEKLDDLTPDIVLADVFMPGLNGYQVCEYIKRTERLSHIPVMLLVGSFEPFDEAEARRVGADDYLTKPFQSIRTLIGKVGNLLSGGGAGSEEATTRKLAPPLIAEKENRPDEEFLERSTADTAPLSQEMREEMLGGGGSSNSSGRAGSLADLSMDDQMIEETPADNFSGQAARDAQPQQPPQYARPTAQYSAADLREAGITPPFESASAPEPEVAASNAYAPAQAAEQSPAPTVGQSSLGNLHTGSQAATEDALLDLGELETPQALTEADDFFLDLLDEPPARTQTSAPSLAPAPQPDSPAPVSKAEELDAAARNIYEEETVEVAAPAPAPAFFEEERADEEPPAQSAAQSAQFEEEETTAAPFAENQFSGSSFSTEERRDASPDVQLAPTERLPDDFTVAATPADRSDTQSGAAESAMAPTGQITLEQLSPEAIDAIARRAVELLSARVVEQVAWEVVPDLAELLIKRRLEEQNNH